MERFLLSLGMPESKLSNGLKAYLQQTGDAKVDVVIDLPSADLSVLSGLSRTQKMQHYRELLDQNVQPVEALIREGGGSILDAAWINQTIKARVPSHCIQRLADLSSVKKIDLLGSVKREY